MLRCSNINKYNVINTSCSSTNKSQENNGSSEKNSSSYMGCGEKRLSVLSTMPRKLQQRQQQFTIAGTTGISVSTTKPKYSLTLLNHRNYISNNCQIHHMHQQQQQLVVEKQPATQQLHLSRKTALQQQQLQLRQQLKVLKLTKSSTACINDDEFTIYSPPAKIIPPSTPTHVHNEIKDDDADTEIAATKSTAISTTTTERHRLATADAPTAAATTDTLLKSPSESTLTEKLTKSTTTTTTTNSIANCKNFRTQNINNRLWYH